jgi:fibronectin type 3 domain-containing protein
VTLSWSAVTGAYSYNVKRATFPGGTYSSVGNPSTNSYTDTSVQDGTTYYYVVTTMDINCVESLNSSEVSAQPYLSTAPPPAPGNLTATGGVGQIQLNWDLVGGATSYNVYRGTTAIGPWNPPQTVETNTFTDNLVLFGPIYYYRVTAVNPFGEGATTPTVSATVASD